jgi:septum formation topological specificity factor MinE
MQTRKLEVGDRIHIMWSSSNVSQRVILISRVTDTLAFAQEGEAKWKFKREARSYSGHSHLYLTVPGERYSNSRYLLETPELLEQIAAATKSAELERELIPLLEELRYQVRHTTDEFKQEILEVIKKHQAIAKKKLFAQLEK